jgi:hypothetical protein
MRFPRAVLRFGAIYDLLVSLVFATPWTAALILDRLSDLHVWAGFAGQNLPSFDPMHLFFVSLFGTIVSLWAIYRLRQPTREALRLDTLGRIAFSSWMIFVLFNDGSRVMIAFLLLEVAWAIAQTWGLWQWKHETAVAI